MDRLCTFIYKNGKRILLLQTLFSIILLSFSFHVKADVEFLTPEEAFVLKVSSNDQKTLNVHFDIRKGYFLYQKHFKFLTLDNKPMANDAIIFPTAIEKKSGNLTHSVFTNQLDLKVPVSKGSNQLNGFLIGYQGCSENGFCYNPLAKKITVDQNGIVEIADVPFASLAKINEDTQDKSSITANAATTATSTTTIATAATASPATNASTKPLTSETASASASAKKTTNTSETDRLTDQLKSGSFFITILIFLGIGILLAFTPCVLPMVPILANILVGEDKPLTSSRSMFLASIYVLSVAGCYAVAGVVAALIGTEMQTSLQSPLFLVGLSFILMLFALSQFNFIHVQFPSFISDALNKLNTKHKQGSAIGACTMGIVSALMVSPCVTPALVGALTYIGQTGNILLGGSALFALALGMGTPMLIIALLGSHLLPKAGAWMTQIKNVTGVLLMVLAGSILFRAFPSDTVMKANACPQVFASVNSQSELKSALELAKKENQPVILDVYADWCVSCKQIDHEVFSNQHVLSSLQNAKLLRFDITKQTADQEKLKKELGIIGPPTVLFFSPNGEEAKAFRLVGKIESNDFINHFNSFLNLKK